MPAPEDNPAAIVAVPPLRGRLSSGRLLRWLSRGRLEQLAAPPDVLGEILGVLERQRPGEGLAALRMWGQTGDRPAAWIAAAEPVYMEPRLDRLFLHALGPGDVSRPEMQRLFDHLQAVLGGGELGFAWLGDCGYICAGRPMATADVPSTVVDRQSPEGSMPAGEAAADTLQLISEIEMALHEQPVNTERQSRGQPPVNSLWLWGGGHAPQRSEARLPTLYADEPLLRGYWASAAATVEDWPGSIAACLEAAPGGFVAVAPAGLDDATAVETELQAVHEALCTGRLARADLISADGIRATLRPADRFRFWRRTAALLRRPPA